MKKTYAPLVIGNWKMNPRSEAEAVSLAQATKKMASSAARAKGASVDVMVAPPFPFLAATKKALGKASVGLVAQHMSPEQQGAFTGEVSAPMLKSVGVSSVIVGHSEQRRAGMSNDQVNATTLAALAARMTPVICVGETERDVRGDFLDVVELQLTAALAGVVKSRLADIVIAYEPVWAIGTGVHATPEDVEEMKLFIQKVLITRYGRTLAPKVRIIYGGSVNAKNVAELWTKAGVNGFLVGGASLVEADFAEIIKTASTHVAA